MKSILLLSFLVLSSTAIAASSPITEDVVLKNKQFSQKIYEALKTKEIKGLISCTKTSCKLLTGGWKYFGMESYGSGDKELATKKLFDSLNVKATTEEGMKFKTIELEVEDPRGGTERNQLVCTRVGKMAEEMGFRDTCTVLNAL